LKLAGPALPGLSLIELLVVLILMVMVTGAAFTLFQLGARHEVHQQDLLNQTQNLRAAIYAVSRDVRMAGNGLSFIGTHRVDIFVDASVSNSLHQEGTGWFRYRDAEEYGARAVYGFNGAGGAPDALTVFRTELESPVPLGRLDADFTPGANNSITLQEKVREGREIANGDILAVASGQRAVIISSGFPSAGMETEVVLLGERFRPGALMPDGGYTFPSGSTVYNLRNIAFVTYYVRRGAGFNHLMANHHDIAVDAPDLDTAGSGQVIVAGNLEDMLVAYFIAPIGSDGPQVDADGVVTGLTADINEGVLDTDGGREVRLVALALTARSSQRSDVAGTADGFTRQVMTKNVAVRNSN
jgi:hypothetical protein